jgi:hypothetical protein
MANETSLVLFYLQIRIFSANTKLKVNLKNKTQPVMQNPIILSITLNVVSLYVSII